MYGNEAIYYPAKRHSVSEQGVSALFAFCILSITVESAVVKVQICFTVKNRHHISPWKFYAILSIKRAKSITCFK